MLKEILLLALRNVKRRKTRSALTILGIVIGIASIVLFVSIGEGMKNIVVDSFGDVGNDLVIMPRFNPDTGEPGKLTYDDLKDIENIKGVKSALPRLTDYGMLEYKRYSEFTQIIGVDPSKEMRLTVNIKEGRFLRDSDRYAAVLGNQRRNITAFEEQKERESYQERKSRDRTEQAGFFGPVGVKGRKVVPIDMRKSITLTINQVDESTAPKKFKVVGILDEGGISGDVFTNPDIAVIVPLNTLREMTGAKKDEISQIVVRLDDPSMAEEVTEKIQEKSDVTVMSLKEVLNSIASFFKIVELIFVAIGSIALLVAGFGIMNTMLMSVLERTREIGVLKSIGATRAYIIKIFLAESALIGFFGGILGVLTGIIVSRGMNHVAVFALKTYLKMPAENLADMPDLTVVPLWLVVFAVVFAVFISMLFGLYPALRASRLSPVEALRYL